VLDHLVGYALRYYHDFVKPAKTYRLPTAQERTALQALADALGKVQAGAGGEELQNLVYEAGKVHGFADNLRAWFGALYEVLLGQSQGPRFGGFIELYGVENTRTLIARALNGELAAADPHPVASPPARQPLMQPARARHSR
jgi:lysyl-tRNA synthetase class 1